MCSSDLMGGSASEEFLAMSDSGEDTFVQCKTCGYAANVEAVTTPIPADVDYSGVPAAHVEETPNTPTIETLVDMSNAKFPRGDRPWSAADTLKNVVFKVNLPDGSSYALAVGLPGDREVDLRRLEAEIGRAHV